MSIDVADMINQDRDGWLTAMKITIVSATRDRVEGRYRIGPQHRQPYGIVHGGVHCGLIESLASIGAAVDAMPRGQSVVGLENSTSFIRAAREGEITGVAVPVTRGRRSQVWTAELRDEEGRIVATGRVRLLCVDSGSDIGGLPVTVGQRGPIGEG